MDAIATETRRRELRERIEQMDAQLQARAAELRELFEQRRQDTAAAWDAYKAAQEARDEISDQLESVRSQRQGELERMRSDLRALGE
jgi:Skp family chaperone for outer membrane proteins